MCIATTAISAMTNMDTAAKDFGRSDEPTGSRGLPISVLANVQSCGSAQICGKALQLKVGRSTISSFGTCSTAPPALRHAASPPVITKALNPCSLSMCATRALVASRTQVQ